MSQNDTGLFTVAVFQDVEWAGRGLDALKAQVFAPDTISVLARDTPDGADLVRRVLGADVVKLDAAPIGAMVAAGPLVEALQASAAAAEGLAGSLRRVGFQPHDGLIFEKLVERGGVLVAIESESRAADALAIFHSFGGGNAAIGAWNGDA
jgi:hypothetical protein